MPEHRLTLIRHGQPQADDTDPALTRMGRAQAHVTAVTLHQQNIRTIHYSTMARARQTASIIAEYHPRAAHVGHDTLHEGVPVIPFGFSTYFAAYGQQRNQFDPETVRERLDLAYNTIFQETITHDTHDLVVCHGNVIRYFVCRVLGIDPRHWARFDIYHCSITQVVINPQPIQRLMDPADSGDPFAMLITFNETQHLPAEMRTVLNPQQE